MTKLQSYYEHDCESFLAALKKNLKEDDSRFGPPGARRNAAGRIRGIYLQAAALLRRRINQTTDELIDAMDYGFMG